MRGCIGWLILLPFAGAWWLTIAIIDACIKKSDALRPLGIIISIFVGGGSIVAGYFIGPIVGWFIMAVGGLVIIVGTWRSLVTTKEEIEKEEEQRWAKEEAKEILERAEIDDYEKLDRICNVLDRIKFVGEEFSLSWKLKELKRKQLKKQKDNPQQ